MTFLASCICPRATKRRLYCHRWISFRHLLLQEGFYCTSYYCSYNNPTINRPCSFKPYCEKQPHRICSKLPQGRPTVSPVFIHSLRACVKHSSRGLLRGTPQPPHDQIEPYYM